MYHEYTPNERVCKRAVELWKRMLRNPKYDALGDDPRSIRENQSMAICQIMAASAPNNVTEEKLVVFGDSLLKRLMKRNDNGFYAHSLDVDYHPCKELRESAGDADIQMEFPWKTHMWLNEEELSLCNGYGADTEYHYPLENGKWLVTTLHGNDIRKVIEYVNGGCPTFRVE